MANPYFLIQFVDKENYNGIMSLHNKKLQIGSTGKSMIIDNQFYISGLEPKIQRDITKFTRTMAQDTSSIWLGWGINCFDTLIDNLKLYKDLKQFTEDILYVTRFFVNWNLKARLFFKAEWGNQDSPSKCEIQDDVDIYCASGANIHISKNRVDLILPMIEYLLSNTPSDKMKAILYNLAHSKKGFSGEIEYFYEFAVFEGFISNWAENNGYSELWGFAIAINDEQTELQQEMRESFDNWINSKTNLGDNEEKKIKHLKEFKESTFPHPNQRKIRRSLKRRFLDYIEKRFPDEIRDCEVINYVKNKFHRIYSRRNEIGHSLEKYTRAPEYIEDSEYLSSAINLISNFEIVSSLNGEPDWKFAPRNLDLKNILTNRSIEKIDLISSLYFKDSECIFTNSDGDFDISNLEYKSGFYFDVETSKIEYKKELSLSFNEQIKSIFYYPNPTGGRVIEKIDASCYIRSTKTDKLYCIKIIGNPSNLSTNPNNHETNVSKIDPKRIKTIILLDNCEFDDLIYKI